MTDNLTIAKISNDAAALKRRIVALNLALGSLHHSYSETLLDGVEQLGADIECAAERLEQACDEILKESAL